MKPLTGRLAGVIAFVTVAFVAATAIFFTITNVSFVPSTTYRAVFADVSGLTEDADVQVAGVRVGRVESLERRDDNTIEVAFTLQDAVPVATDSSAAVRYKDLVGRRILEIRPGEGTAPRLDADGVIPVERTTPALDLDELYNGFAPLFQGLQPEQVNQLSGSLIQVLQGEAGSVNALLDTVGSLTNTLADRDQVIGELITNLDGVLTTVNERSGRTTELVQQLQQLVSGLSGQRETIGTAVDRSAVLTDRVQGLLREARPDIAGNVAEIDRLSKVINSDSESVDGLLQRAPGYYQLLGRVGIYQSAFQFYLCGVQLRVQAPDAPPVMTDMITSQEQRCQY